MDNEIENKLLFIGGTGRSGTNITRKILAEHSEVASFPFEYRFIIDPDGIIDFYQSISGAWSPYMADIKIKRLQSFLENLSNQSMEKENYNDWELSKWFPNYQLNIRTLIDELRDFKYSGYWPGAIGKKSTYKITFSEYKTKQELSRILGKFLKKNIQDYIRINNKRFFVEDNTWNVLFAKEISEILPESKMIHVVRDPRDVIASFMEQGWCPNDFKRALKMYIAIMTRWFSVEDSLTNGYCKIIKLEELVLNKEKTVQDICRFSGIPFEQNMLDVNLNMANMGRWKKSLTRQNHELMERDLGSIFARLGYDL